MSNNIANKLKNKTGLIQSNNRYMEELKEKNNVDVEIRVDNAKEMHRISVVIKPSSYKKLTKKRKELNISMNQIVTILLENWIKDKYIEEINKLNEQTKTDMSNFKKQEMLEKQITLTFQELLFQEVKQNCEKQGIYVNKIINNLIDVWLLYL